MASLKGLRRRLRRSIAVEERIDLCLEDSSTLTYLRSLAQMTNDEIDYICRLATPEIDILEFGAGYSTLIWSTVFRRVSSVETRAPWLEKVREMSNSAGAQNVELVLAVPEDCAYDSAGHEKWVVREPSDYGAPWEFAGYLAEAAKSIDAISPDSVVLVDGHVRSRVIELLIDREHRGPVLLHDVEPSRAYLNSMILSHPRLVELATVDSLVHLEISR